ncbi:MAG: amidohydrolase [Lachnospiraceae bacterium]|nr:amidohydrolase [Lachnospiraceae bacterium]
MIVDAHVHVGRFETIDLECDFEDIIRIADRMKVDKLFCTHVKALYYDYRLGDQEIYEAMRKWPDRILGYTSVTSPRHGQPIYDHVKKCIFDWGFHGIKVYSHPRGVGGYEAFLSVADRYMYPIYEMAQEWKVPVLAHATSEEMDVICRDFPNLTMMMAHMGCTPISGGDWHTAIAVARRHPNLILDTTASGMDFGMVEEAVRVIGAERVIWGSDMPMIDAWLNIDKIRGAEIRPEEKQLILGDNIMRYVKTGRETVEKIKRERNL